MTQHRATSAEIDLDAFRHNLRTLKSLAGPAALMAVVKADAYGHGAVPCAQAALSAGADILGIGILQEGVELRENGITAPVLVLGGVFPNEIDDLIHHNLSTSLATSELARTLSDKAERAGKTVGVHIKIDTGMGRLGVQPDDFSCLLENVTSYKNLQLEGVFTHLACADQEDAEITRRQLARFDRTLEALQAGKLSAPLNLTGPLRIHSANTAGLLRFPESRYNLARPGIGLFGSLPSPVLDPVLGQLIKERNLEGLRPVMRWKTKIAQVQALRKGTAVSYGGRFVTGRDSRIATLPVGYADGLSRSLSNNMEMLVKGKRVRQVGTICMDMCLIDVTDLPGVEAGEEAVIFGSQGEEKITVEELAERAGTIPYEILCGVGKRVPRIYLP
ncbi:hypothetical protein UZ36_00655 [Candidatus Nitromaritima sp. SCGC AAA799-C22]|nr:hypothetical protein UZ36_00655 [Candidatus Nitromaritima sp. SCGC AAA799-C22]